MIDSRLKLGSTSIVSGPSCSGKTTFVNELIKNRNSIFSPLHNHVVWFYGEIEPKDKIPHVKYLKGLPSDDIIIQEKTIIVLDDLFLESGSSSIVTNLFTRVSHCRVLCYISNSNYVSKQ